MKTLLGFVLLLVVGTQAFSDEDHRRLDILVVIDNSGSMQEEQIALEDKLEPLLRHVRWTNWAINVVTTDDPCSRVLITRRTPNRVEAFRKAIRAGTSGSGTEQGLKMSVKSMRGDCVSNPKSWLRKRSHVAVLIVSDEDDAGIPNSEFSVENTLKYFRSIRTFGRSIRVFGILGGQTSGCSSTYDAPKYREIIKRTGGLVGPICAASYRPILKAVSRSMSDMVEGN